MGHQRSPNQIQASQVNGRRSRGPKSDAGKAKSSNNARKHGLWSKNNKPAPDGDPEFKKHVRRLRRQIKPVNQLERDMIRQYAVAFWLKEQVLSAAHDMAPESFNRLLTSQDLSLHRALKAIGGLLKGKFGPRAHKIVTTFEMPPHLRKRYGDPKKQNRRCENKPGEVVESKPAPLRTPVHSEPPRDPLTDLTDPDGGVSAAPNPSGAGDQSPIPPIEREIFEGPEMPQKPLPEQSNSTRINDLRSTIKSGPGARTTHLRVVKTRCNTKSTTYTRPMDFAIDRPQYLGVLLPLPPRIPPTQAPACRIGVRSLQTGRF